MQAVYMPHSSITQGSHEPAAAQDTKGVMATPALRTGSCVLSPWTTAPLPNAGWHQVWGMGIVGVCGSKARLRLYMYIYIYTHTCICSWIASPGGWDLLLKVINKLLWTDFAIWPIAVLHSACAFLGATVESYQHDCS